MGFFFVYILPIILMFLLLWFYKATVEHPESIPRIFRWLVVLLVFIPFLGFFLTIGCWIIYFILVINEDLELKDNKLTNFLFKS